MGSAGLASHQDSHVRRLVVGRAGLAEMIRREARASIGCLALIVSTCDEPANSEAVCR